MNANRNLQLVQSVEDALGKGTTYLIGNSITIADIAVFDAIGGGTKVHPCAVDLKSLDPEVGRWFKLIENNPATANSYQGRVGGRTVCATVCAIVCGSVLVLSTKHLQNTSSSSSHLVLKVVICERLHEMLAGGLPNNRQLDGRDDGGGVKVEKKEEANVERVREG